MSTPTHRLASLGFSAIAMLLVWCGSLSAADPGNVTLSSQTADSVTLANGADRVFVRVLKPNLLQVDFRPNNQTSANTLIMDPGFASKTWSPGTVNIVDGASEVVLTTTAMVVRITKSPCRVNIYQTDGTTRIFGEPNAGGMSDSRVKVEFDTGLNWYGIQSSPASRGRDMGISATDTPAFTTLSIVTKLTRQNVSPAVDLNARTHGSQTGPFAWTTGTASKPGFGILWDNDGGNVAFTGTSLEMNKTGERCASAVSSTKLNTLWFAMVGTPSEITQAMLDVSGRPQMFPKYAHGFGNTEWGINEGEMRTHINTYRSRKIPLDHFILDFDWKAWDLNDYGNFAWNVAVTSDSTLKNVPGFPSANDTTLKTHADGMGVKLMGITKPRLHVDTVHGGVVTAGSQTGATWRNATSVGWWLPSGAPSTFTTDYWGSMRGRSDRVGNLNFFIPAARAWYGKNTIDYAFDKGIIGYWHDEGDEGPDSGDILSASNHYNTLYQEGVYTYQRANRSGTRVWSMNRHSFLGSQRYGYGIWSGDITTDWRVLKTEAPRMLQTINAGMARTGTDAGGTSGSGDAVGTISTDGVSKNVPTGELYARWVQFAAMQPTFRIHGVYLINRQPWLHGTESEAAATDVIRLRSSLIPYIYAHDRIYAETGIPFVQPLIWDNPKDANVADRSDAWMFGRHLLAAPILQPRASVTSPDGTQSIGGTTTKTIYLPAGTWYDYFRGTAHAGGGSFDYPISSTTMRELPLFVRKGAIIPSLNAPLQYVTEKPVTTVRLDLFPDTTLTSFPYYDDDGVSYQYEGGTYFKQNVSVQQSGGTVTVTLDAKQGSYTPALTHYLVAINKFSATAVSGFTTYATQTALEAASGEGWAMGTSVHGSVVLIKVAAGSARTFTVTGSAPTLGIATTSLPAATRNAPYDVQLCADGLGAASTWSVTPALPTGLILDARTGRLSGSPTVAGSASYTFQVTSGSTVSKALTLAVSAAPFLAHEAFPYTSGGIDGNGVGGENGFAEPWQRIVGGNGQGALPVYPAVYVPGLAATGITTTGGAVEFTSVRQDPTNPNSNKAPEYSRTLVTGFNDGGTVGANAWIGFIGRGTSPGDGWLGVGLFNGATEQMLIGQRFGATNWGVEVGGGGGSGNSSTTLATSVFVVVNIRVTGAGSRTVRMWINPAAGATAPSDASAAVSFATTTDLTFDTLRLRGDSATSKLAVDELRVGGTFADACGSSTGQSELDVSRAGTAVSDGSTETVSGSVATTAQALTYVLANSGSAALTVTVPVTLLGQSNCSAAVTTQPSGSIAGGASSSLVVSVTPTAAGSWSFTVSAVNTDSDENPFNWIVSGTAAATPPVGILVAEPFDYGTGSLAGLNGGTGWLSAWDAGANAVAAPGLTAAGLTAAGNRANVTTTSFRLLPSALANGTWWVSFLAQSSTPGSLWGGLSFFSGSTERLFIGQRYGASVWGMEGGGSSVSTAAGSGNVSLIVVRFVLRAGADDATIWVNPSLGATPSDASGLAFPAFGDLDPDRIRIASGTSLSVDEVRIATSFAGVAPSTGTPAITAVRVFYNNSTWDGNDAAANAGDDAAIATDKTALLPGGTGTFANYTSFSRGLNGVMIDISHLPGIPLAADFACSIGNTSAPGSWLAGSAPTSVTVRAAAGTDGADRVTLVWADNAVQKQWLRVAVQANARTGLAVPYVFFVGNAIGDSGNSTVDAITNATDQLAARNNPRGPANLAPVTFSFDYNRDRLVNATDQLQARTNGTSPVTALQLISVP